MMQTACVVGAAAVHDDWEDRAGLRDVRNRARLGARRMLLLTLASLAILNLTVYGIRILHGVYGVF